MTDESGTTLFTLRDTSADDIPRKPRQRWFVYLKRILTVAGFVLGTFTASNSMAEPGFDHIIVRGTASPIRGMPDGSRTGRCGLSNLPLAWVSRSPPAGLAG